MRFLLVALLAGLCAAAVYSAAVDFHGYDAKKQHDIWRLFKYVNQPSYYKDHVEIANNYNFDEAQSYFTKPEVYNEFYHKYWQYHYYLQKGEIFSVYYEEHLKQAIALFKLFYYAKDYETFYKTAVWARNHFNEGVWIYAFSVAVIHRPDTYFYVLPPIYEVYPHYFYNAEVIHQAQYYKQLYYGGKSEYNDKTIVANYSGWYLNVHPEQSLSYFTEDVGVNSFYYYYNLYYPFWMNGEEFHLKYDHRGELFFYIHQQILARYYLERISNGFGEIEWFNWEVPFETEYYSSLQYPNGLAFPHRPKFAHLYEYFYNYGQKWSFKSHYGYSYTYVQDYERRIRDAIDSGYIYTKDGYKKVDLFSHEGLNILGNLVEGNADSPYYKYYGSFVHFARHLLGYSYQPLDYHKVHPSALEHFETSLRDPAFYQLYKRLLAYFYKYKYHLDPYTEQDLVFPGVKVKNVEFDRLVTYFDKFYADLSNAVYVTPEEFEKDTFKVHVEQQRLTHKPFTYKIYADADQEYEADVYVYLGPKYDEYHRYINMSENWVNFVQFDHFQYHLKSGENVITRNSHDIYNYFHDRTTYYDYYKKTFGDYDKSFKYQYNYEHFWFGFPQRMYLPIGTYEGFPYQFYVYIQKHVPYKAHGDHPYVGFGHQYVSGYPFGYPFDRPVEFEHVYHHIPNGYFYETKIYHRDAHAVVSH